MLDNKTEFLAKYQIEEKAYRKSKLKWDDLREIYNDFTSKSYHLNSIGLSISNALQGQEGVHSVRYRVKDPEHLIEKIIRKVAENPNRKIDLSNYQHQITDLIGVRAIHLFKSNWQSIDHFVRQNWDFKEDPIAYFRAGDAEDIKSTFNSSKFEAKVHKAGYRSLHYVLITKPTKIEYFVELQVRTLFEEGWSEIDHKIRYPYDTNNDLINSLLMIFNRLAGSADEIGEYVKTLNIALKAKEEEYLINLDIREKEIETLKAHIDGLKLNEQQKSKLFNSIDQITRQQNPLSNLGKFNELTELIANAGKFKDISHYSNIFGGIDPKLASIGKLVIDSQQPNIFISGDPPNIPAKLGNITEFTDKKKKD